MTINRMACMCMFNNGISFEHQRHAICTSGAAFGFSDQRRHQRFSEFCTWAFSVSFRMSCLGYQQQQRPVTPALFSSDGDGSAAFTTSSASSSGRQRLRAVRSACERKGARARQHRDGGRLPRAAERCGSVHL